MVVVMAVLFGQIDRHYAVERVAHARLDGHRDGAAASAAQGFT